MDIVKLCNIVLACSLFFWAFMIMIYVSHGDNRPEWDKCGKLGGHPVMITNRIVCLSSSAVINLGDK